jgi:hypothetical protein
MKAEKFLKYLDRVNQLEEDLREEIRSFIPAVVHECFIEHHPAESPETVFHAIVWEEENKEILFKYRDEFGEDVTSLNDAGFTIYDLLYFLGAIENKAEKGK